MQFNWLNDIKAGVASKAAEAASKAADAAKYIQQQAAANQKKRQAAGDESSEYYDEEEDSNGEQEISIPTNGDKNGQAYEPVSKHIVEMRLIIKQAKVSVVDENQRIRVEFTRSGKSLSTSLKPVDEETGIVEIK